MVKCYNLETTKANYEEYKFFYIRLKNDINGNPRHKVWVIDHDNGNGVIYETILKGYKGIKDIVSEYIEEVSQ